MTSRQMSQLGGEPPGESVLVWNGVVVPLPALALRPASAAELAEAVRLAVDYGLPVAFTSGDRGRRPGSTAERALTLDLSLLGSRREATRPR